MSGWDQLAKGQLTHRSLEQVRSTPDHWVSPSGISLKQFLEETGFLSEPTGTEKSTFIDNVGHSSAAMYDLMVLERKCRDCCSEIFDNISSNRSEFGNVIAYTYSLLAAKTILAYLGLFLVSSRGKNLLFDFIPQFGGHKEAKKYREAKKDINRPIKVVFGGKRQVTHADIWSILTAIARKGELTGRSHLDRWLSQYTYNRETLVRNSILYSSSYWPTEHALEEEPDIFSSFPSFAAHVASNKQHGPHSDYFMSLKCMQMLSVARDNPAGAVPTQ